MDSHLTTKLPIFTSIKRYLKMMKNVFYFLLKCLFLFLRYLIFFLEFFGYISKFMTSQTGILTITIRILSNFSWSKSSQTMKFILLTEYKMRNIFLEKSSSNSFYKNQNYAYRWMNTLKCYKFRCYDMSKSSYKCPSVQVLTTCFYLTWSFFFFLKKERSRTSLPVKFSAWFLKKKFICY